MNITIDRRSVLLLIFIMILSVSGCSSKQSSPAESAVSTKNVVATVPTVLSSIADSGRADKQTDGKPGAPTAPIVVEMNRYGKGVAYIESVGNQMRVVHNGKPGKLYKEIESNRLTLSQNGQRVGYTAKEGDKWVIVVNNDEIGTSSEGGTVSFSDDSRHVASETKVGEKWFIAIDGVKNSGAEAYYDKPIFVSNSKKLFYIENTHQEGAGLFRLVLTDLKFHDKYIKFITSPSYLAVNNEKTMMAAVIKDNNKQGVISFSFDQPDNVTVGALYDEIISTPVVSKDGKAVSYLAKKGTEFYVVLNDKAERIPQGEFPVPPVLRHDLKGVGIVIVGKDGVYLHQAFYNDGIKDRMYLEVSGLAYSSDSRNRAYVAIKDNKFLIVANGVDGPAFDRVIAPKFSPDGKYLVYSARMGEKRFVVVADSQGKVISQHPGYERLFETVFTEDGKAVAYGVKDGNQLAWKVVKL